MGLKDDAYLQSVSGDIKVTLPDMTVKEEKRLETTPDQEHLKESIAVLEQERKGHRELGREQQLFLFDPDTLEFTFFLPRGIWILHKLMTFIRGEYRERGYEQVGTSRLLDTHLCEILGREPIIGPGHCQIFDMEVHSYIALPLRFAEDREIKDEVKHVLEFICYVYDKLGFTCELMLSKRPEKYFGDMETWDKAEKAFEDALNEFGHTWQINKSNEAFHGPKIDISVSVANKRNLQFATIQLDFQLPLHFNLTYSAEIETTWERPIMIRASIFRSFKSMFDILFEHCKGKWPFWLSCQAIVCPVSDEYKAYGEQVKHQVVAAGYYADMDYSYRTIEEKVLKAQLAQYNYILVAGEEEATTGKVSVQVRDKKEPLVLTIQDLIEHFKEEVDNFH